MVWPDFYHDKPCSRLAVIHLDCVGKTVTLSWCVTMHCNTGKIHNGNQRMSHAITHEISIVTRLLRSDSSSNSPWQWLLL
jgi:hypothetical protein